MVCYITSYLKTQFLHWQGIYIYVHIIWGNCFHDFDAPQINQLGTVYAYSSASITCAAGWVRSNLNLDKVGITLAARYNCSFKCVQVSHGSSGMEENLWLLWRNEVLTGYSHFETKSHVIERIGTHLLAILSPALKLLNRTVLWLLTARYPAEDGWPLPRKSLLLYYNKYITRIYIYILVHISPLSADGVCPWSQQLCNCYFFRNNKPHPPKPPNS